MQKQKINSDWLFWKEGQEDCKKVLNLPHDAMLEEMICQDNTITVIADNSRQPNSRWYSGSGIYRNVNLNSSQKEYILPDGIKVRTLSHEPAVMDVCVEAVRDPDTEVQIHILDGERVVAVASGVHAVLHIPDAKLWSGEEPSLYTVRTRLIKNGAAVDESANRIGIRTIAWDSETLLVQSMLIGFNTITVQVVMGH